MLSMHVPPPASLAFSVFNSPIDDERQYNQTTPSADFGRINRNSTNQSNLQRFI
jgi:hypothetical protein